MGDKCVDAVGLFLVLMNTTFLLSLSTVMVKQGAVV